MDTLPPILVADDDDDDFYFLTQRLEDAGIRNPVVRFLDGEETMGYLDQMCRGGTPENQRGAALLFLDIKMPRANGFDVLNWIREQRSLDDLGVIVLSGSALAGDMARAAALGVDRYLVKYPTEEDLRAALDSRPPWRAGRSAPQGHGPAR